MLLTSIWKLDEVFDLILLQLCHVKKNIWGIIEQIKHNISHAFKN